MQMRYGALTLLVLALSAPAPAEEPAADKATEKAAAVGPGAPRLFDEIPNFPLVLERQWSAGLPEGVGAAEASTAGYGRLGDQPMRATTLPECILLALRNNTDLRIQELGPLSARAEVEKAYGAFDAALFGTVNYDRTASPATTSLTAGASSGGTLNTLSAQHFDYSAGLRKVLHSGGQLSLAAGMKRTRTNASLATPLVPSYTSTLGLSLNQPLLRDFGWRYSMLFVEIARTGEDAAFHQYRAAIATLVTQVERAYWSLVAAIEQVRVQKQALESGNELLRQNQGKFNVGALPRTAVLEAQSEVARREAVLIEVENNRDVARDNLRALVNAPGDESQFPMIDPVYEPRVPAARFDLNESLKSALEQRPEIAAARLGVRTQGLQRKVAENQLLPRLDFTGQIGLNGLSGGRPVSQGQQIPVTDPATGNTIGILEFGGGQAPADLQGQYGRSLQHLVDGRFYNYAAGASIEIPLGNTTARADYKVANINFEKARLDLRKLEEGVTLEVNTAIHNLQTDLKSIDATRVAVDAAEENVRSQRARYDVGLATTKDLLDFQDQLTQARAAVVRAMTRYMADLAELHRVDGTLLAQRNVIVERASPSHVPWWETF